MPDLIPVAAIPAGTAVPAGDAAAVNAARSAATALMAVTGTATGPGLAESAAIRTVTGALAVAVRELPGLFRHLSGQSGDACTAGQPSPAAGSFWFQMEAAADAAARLAVALDTAHAAALQLHRGGEDR
jgi:hypothetical protein